MSVLYIYKYMCIFTVHIMQFCHLVVKYMHI